MPTTSGITLRTATDDTFKTIVSTLAVPFGEAFTDDELDSERKLIEPERVIGAFDGETPVGVSGAYSFGLTTPGGVVDAAGITLVGVLPSHRRRGILRMMMADLFESAAVRGEPVAVLWASEAAIYQRFGYGVCTLQTVVEAAKDKVRFRTPSGLDGRATVRLLERDDAIEPFAAIYESRRPARPGSLTRSHAFWTWSALDDNPSLQSQQGAKHRALLSVDGEPRAYAIYRLRADWQSTGPQAVLTVVDLVGLDAAAEQALWEWLLGVDLVGVIKVPRGPAPHPLMLMVTEPRRLNATFNDGMWLRILDVPAAMAARTFRGPGSLVLELTDELIPANAGRWQLTVPGPGEPGVLERAGEGAAPDVSLDISALATTYLGTARWGDLARAGRVTECRPGAIADADALWASSVSPHSSTMF